LKEYKIPLTLPRFTGNEEKYILDCLHDGDLSYSGEYIKRFESEFAAYTDAKYAVALSESTAAIHLSLIVAGVKPGEGVFAPALSPISPINAISYVGAHPVFVDVDLDSMGISPESVQAFIDKFCYFKDGILINRFSNEKISALLAVHTFGQSPRIDELRLITDEYNLKLIEDASIAVGTRYKDRHVGTFGELGCFGFSSENVLSIGTGGMVTTNNQQLAEEIRHLRNFAKYDDYFSYHDKLGFNYKMTNVSAAVGVAQLEYLSQTISYKRKIHYSYEKEFSKLNNFELLTELNWCRSNYSVALLRVPKLERDNLVTHLREHGIESRIFGELNNRHPIYSANPCGNIDNSIELYRTVVIVPCHRGMEDIDVEYFIDIIKEYDVKINH